MDFRTIMDRIICAFEVKTDSDNTGIITGYGSVFGAVDAYGDIVAPGAFKKTISDVMTGAKSWPAMLLQHGGATSDDKTPMGIWISMEEDDKGLRLQGKLANTKRGREAYELLKMKPRPALNGLSIGYRAKDYEIHKSGPVRRTLKAIDLVECSLVTFPANRLATITGVKAAIEAPPAKPEYTMRDLALDDFKMLAREMTKGNRSGW
jgi:uncharacterized protein